MIERKAISELPASTVKLITATQIATSVSNIVKELTENSLDAGSTIVRVKLENSGLNKIEVIDNGSGVSKEDVKRMALPHYTSKICQHQDLESLTSYGFRGEALAAICAVAKLSVTTKTAEDPIASTYTMDGSGNVIDEKPSHLSQGTMIVTTSLFWNVPVRKQFYQTSKRKKDELTKVENLLLSYGLIHPELHLSLHHDHSLVWQKNRATDFKTNIMQTLGFSICTHMEFVEESEPINIFLMFPKRTAPLDVCFRHQPDRCFTFINKRPVISKDIEKVMKNLYGFVQDSSEKAKLYPIFVVSLKFSGDEVDVNLEPNKSQVLMKRQTDVLELIGNRVASIVGENPTSTEKDRSLQPEDPLDNSVLSDVDQMEKEFNDSSRPSVEKTNETCQIDETVMEDFSVPVQPRTELFAEVSRSTVASDDKANKEVIYDDDLFHGFNEPFDEPIVTTNVGKNTVQTEDTVHPINVPTIGSDQWSRGLITNSDGRTVHPFEVFRGNPQISKRSSDSPLSESLAKRPKLVEIHEASRIIGPLPSLLETVNGKVSKIPTDAFGEYCKEVRNEMISQDPTMSFTELTQHLNNGWKNLDKRSREKYENKAEANKQRYNFNKTRTPYKAAPMSNTSLDRFLQSAKAPQKENARSVVQRSLPSFRKSTVQVDFSLSNLNLSQKSFCFAPKEQWFCVKKFANGGWLCSNTHEIIAVNFSRLYEMILYSRLTTKHIIPSRPLVNPIVIDKTTLGDDKSWRKLLNMTSERETASTKIVTDPRVVANGIGIRLGNDSDRTGVSVYQIPANVNSFDLSDVRNFLLRVLEDDSTIESCRPEQAVISMKLEAEQLAAKRFTEPDETEVCELLERWLSTEPENVCLHGEPVAWNYVIPEVQNESLEITS